MLAGFSLLKGRMGRNQLADDLNALVRDRDEFSPLLRRPDWFDEHEREKSRRDLSTDRNGSRVSVVVPGRTELVHDGSSIRIKVLRLPALAPGHPRHIAAKSLGIADEM